MPSYTPTQGRYLAFIHAYTEGFGLPPAESEIAEAIGVAPPSVNQMMKTLERKGLIRRQPGVPRSIEILVPTDDLPKWRKTITRTVNQWVMTRPRTPSPIPGKPSTIYQLKITLLGTKPPIWRRIETADVTLGTLHELIQTSMGWTNSHMHQFEIMGERYTDPRFMMDDLDDTGPTDYSGIRISDLVRKHGPRLKLLYEYDFGDGWQHSVVLERVDDAEPGQKYPRCTEGQGACPPEDVGGVYGFADYVEAITNPDHEDHQQLMEWNGPFDPAAFDPKQATRAMRKGLPSW